MERSDSKASEPVVPRLRLIDPLHMEEKFFFDLLPDDLFRQRQIHMNFIPERLSYEIGNAFSKRGELFFLLGRVRHCA